MNANDDEDTDMGDDVFPWRPGDTDWGWLGVTANPQPLGEADAGPGFDSGGTT